MQCMVVILTIVIKDVNASLMKVRRGEFGVKVVCRLAALDVEKRTWMTTVTAA